MTLQFLRLIHVRHRTGLSRSTLYARIAAGKFPKPVPLGGRAVGWLESEVEAYLADLVKQSRGESPQKSDRPSSRPAPARSSMPIGIDSQMRGVGLSSHPGSIPRGITTYPDWDNLTAPNEWMRRGGPARRRLR